MRRSRVLTYAVLAVLAACQTGMVSGRQANLSPTQQQTAGSGPDVASLGGSISSQRPQASVVSTRQPRDVRRLMEKTQAASAAADRAAAELLEHLPKVETVRFKKIALNISRPSGMSVNGSTWIPGACGSKPSALGYQCSWAAPGGAVLHWTYSSTSSSPPINRCTAQPQAVPNLEIQEFDGPTVHFALQAATKEMLHVAFVDPQMRMYPSEGVHGRAVNPCSGRGCSPTSTPQVEVLHHDRPGSAWSVGRVSSRNPELMEGWAAWVSADTEGQTQTLCFSRHVHTKLMKLSHQTNDELLLQYATSDAANYMGSGTQRGMISLDVVSGKVTEVKPPVNVLLAHAVLMLVAFGVLLPTGLLLARHKWLFVDEEQGLSPLWALCHFGVLLLSAMVGLAGMIVVLVRFGNSVTGLVTSTHQVLGLLSIGLSLVLVVMYGLRPFLVSGQKGAPSPLLGPQKVGGVVTIAASWTSLFLGCVVIHQNWAAAYITWLTPCILITALVACAATLLELRYQKLVRSGAYNPKTCTLSGPNTALPLARVRTHREPTMPKKQEPESVGLEQRGSPGIGAHHGDSAVAFASSVAATILARGSGLFSPRGDGSPLSRSISLASSGSRSSSAGGAVRRARHSTPNASAAAASVQSGFPISTRAVDERDSA